MEFVYRIHPSIGVARVGDNDGTGDDDFFIGSETPRPAPPPTSGYKKDGRIKRQGARFRVYQYGADAADGNKWKPLREVTAAEARIEWSVTLANRKAIGPVFPPGNTIPPAQDTPLRNANITAPAERERLLKLEAQDTITGVNATSVRLESFFFDRAGTQPDTHRVRLGDLLTDAAGRLIVLGGLGRSFSPEGLPLEPGDTFNNDGWCDDTSDGIITARITPHGQPDAVDAQSARVLVGPPDYAPPIGNIITLFDIAEDTATQLPAAAGPLPGPEAGTVSFARHIFPVLERTAHFFWVTNSADVGHGPNRGGNFLRADLLSLLRDPNPDETSPARTARLGVLRRLRVPPGVTPPAGIGNLPRNMPRLQSELDSGQQLSLTALQYGRMVRWWRGEFDPDTAIDLSAPVIFDAVSDPAAQVEALDCAGLDACVGGSFFPGIEASRLLREPTLWESPFRVAAEVPAGALTEGMSLPWQTDFLACSQAWWPAQRPNQVHVRNASPTAPLVRMEWARDTGGAEGFITSWSRMGFLVAEGDVFVEKERDEAPDSPLLPVITANVEEVAVAARGETPGTVWTVASQLPAEPPLGDASLSGYTAQTDD